MPETIFGLTAEQVERLRALLAAYDTGRLERTPAQRPAALQYFQYDLPIPVENTESEAIPAYGVMQISDGSLGSADEGTAIRVRKPISASVGGAFALLHLINGPEEIAANGFGVAFAALSPRKALYDFATDGALSGTRFVGIVAGSWKLRKQRPGFYVVGPSTTEEVYVQRAVYGLGVRRITSSGGTNTIDGRGYNCAILEVDTDSGLLLQHVTTAGDDLDSSGSPSALWPAESSLTGRFRLASAGGLTGTVP